ncbi:MAG: NUDIX hydrolase [Lachnospiraceae bacterium]|nr:NUDIX hydrolase [Lachnospiraceae bacterium]
MKRLLSIEQQADGFLKKYRLRYDLGNGSRYDWEMVSPRLIKDAKDLHHGANAVEMVARFPDGDFLLQKEYRYPANRFIYSFPCGMIDPGESAEEAIRRELYEETGVSLLRIDRLLPPAFLAAGLTDEMMQIAHVTVDGVPEAHPDFCEEIIPMKLSKEEILHILQEDPLSINLSCLLVLDTFFNGL